jgi:tRNA threonylcarbamoyladenosine biosynthesis protein TsaE
MSIFERLKRGQATGSAEEMMALAAEFAHACPEDLTLELSGELGAGKTVFVKGLAGGWNIRETVTSPTFNIFSLYSGDRNLLHMDAYRLESIAQMEDLMIEEFLRSPYCLAVEWPEKIADCLPPESWRLRFTIEAGESHQVRLEKGG